MDAGARITEFSNVDKRVREHLKENESAMAADLVFAEGRQAAAAARLVDEARLEEQQVGETLEGVARQQQAYALVTAALVGVFAIALLTFVPPPVGKAAPVLTPAVSRLEPLDISGAAELRLRDGAPAAQPPSRSRASSQGSGPVLRAAAEICTAFGRSEPEQLTKLLGRAADLMGASGLIVWIGDVAGSDLKPVVAHGYPAQVLDRMPSVPRSADNAAAAAYRTGTIQVVLARSDNSPGAVVAPLLSSQGCVGALTAEIKADREISETVQVLATLFAAHLATILTPAVTATPAVRQETSASA
jgi:hypothetical protein